jgi:hypothetical protein
MFDFLKKLFSYETTDAPVEGESGIDEMSGGTDSLSVQPSLTKTDVGGRHRMQKPVRK